jgi:hypothetical protein
MSLEPGREICAFFQGFLAGNESQVLGPGVRATADR